MLKEIKEVKFNEDEVATLLCDNGLMITIDYVQPNTTVEPAIQEGYVTRISDINGTVLQTKYWVNKDTLNMFLKFVDKLSIQDIPSQLTTTASEI
jgi:hypothetical protein